MTQRQLVLEDGSVFVGQSLGAESICDGEVVFNTGMTGYQEILSDPSYSGQIVAMTYPLIGNYGLHRDDFESLHPAIAGLVVKEAANAPSHWRSEQSLHDLLVAKDIPGISGIDTRQLTRKIRSHGTLKGRLCDGDVAVDQVVADLKTYQLPTGQVKRVSTPTMYTSPGSGPRIVLYDFGMKKGILRACQQREMDVLVVPYNTPAAEVLEYQPDGVFLSNGPGDPKDVPEAIAAVRELMEQLPVFGICLGHQIMALAAGADTIKMTFGHRGANHPVKDLQSGKFYMTSQNHGYTVDPDSLHGTGFEVSHKAVNDGTVEGLVHQTLPAASVQFHPEAAPGPDDFTEWFDRFLTTLQRQPKRGVQYA
ncbi:carbamoyl phosphate synthase small subunit [Tuberibacillus sp. Marseille-P3662]|uniref:carbamoyl phosphate synthase small subunit n=1 Tax=Tuberibacillus sp. Marseille-P3662 TaxID=1965358 RepID=UPI000A1CF0EB|nr:carbamoyl phosphate synthase small subunit [Tuberibacillus sp. Marseille-P3662]